MAGDWKVNLGKDNYGLGHFKQNGSRIQGSILTNSGDYRYLDGAVTGDKVKLYGFDGTFSFVVDLVLRSESFQGKMYAGKTYNVEISAVRDENFKLANPNTITKLKGKGPLKLKLKNLSGEELDISQGDLAGKAKVVSIFGSWCPNCIDELNYFLDWRKENKAKLNEVSFLAVAFENFPELSKAKKVLTKLKAKTGMDYPILIGDHASTKTVTKIFPIDKTRAFPTTLFLNKKNEIIKVHTGFSGQATGNYFKNFQIEFNNTIDKLIR